MHIEVPIGEKKCLAKSRDVFQSEECSGVWKSPEGQWKLPLQVVSFKEREISMIQSLTSCMIP